MNHIFHTFDEYERACFPHGRYTRLWTKLTPTQKGKALAEQAVDSVMNPDMTDDERFIADLAIIEEIAATPSLEDMCMRAMDE